MKPLNVIVVEDSEDDLILIERALKKSGYDPYCTRVETASSLMYEDHEDRSFKILIR